MSQPSSHFQPARYIVQARNFASEVENRIHNDELASRLGFQGALVPGVAVFGHLTHPLVEALGSRWLERSHSQVRFLKPAYDGDQLEIDAEPIGATKATEAGIEVSCRARGELLATLSTSTAPAEAAQPASFSTAVDAGERVEISHNVIKLGHRFPDRSWKPSEAENLAFSQQVLDDLPPYADGWVHPHLLLSQANTCLTHRFEMPAWIHVGSEISCLHGIRVGDEIIVKAEPTRLWERKGHEFVELLIEFRRGDDVTTRITHTAIYRFAGMD